MRDDRRLREAAPGEPTVSVLEYAVRRGGIRRGTQAATLVESWLIASRKLGHELGQGEGVTAAVREYASYWKRSERTAWRELDRFREVFPEEATPERIVQLLLRAKTSQPVTYPGLVLSA
jgi:hypothetical protein